VRPLGRGGQSPTFLVVEEGVEDGEYFVLKRLNANRIERGRSEIRACEELSHPNVLRLIDSDLDGDKPYLVTEYCSGGSLSNVNIIEYPLTERLQMFSAICRGVGHAHSHTPPITHRDLKPDNIFLRKDKRTPVVGDFGICFFDEGERVTLVDEAVGPRWYMAPELAHGLTENVTPRADVYSLGKVLYWMLSARIFDRELHRHQRFDLTIGQTAPDLFFIYDLLDKTILVNPSERLSNANEVADAVDNIIRKIEMHAHHLNLSTPQRCMYCGEGFYQVALDVSRESHGSEVVSAVKNFGFYGGINEPIWIILVCDYCGNVQVFRPDRANYRNTWKRS
jgi:serine/threonine protein kinase